MPAHDLQFLRLTRGKELAHLWLFGPGALQQGGQTLMQLLEVSFIHSWWCSETFEGEEREVGSIRAGRRRDCFKGSNPGDQTTLREQESAHNEVECIK